MENTTRKQLSTERTLRTFYKLIINYIYDGKKGHKTGNEVIAIVCLFYSKKKQEKSRYYTSKHNHLNKLKNFPKKKTVDKVLKLKTVKVTENYVEILFGNFFLFYLNYN